MRVVLYVERRPDLLPQFPLFSQLLAQLRFLHLAVLVQAESPSLPSDPCLHSAGSLSNFLTRLRVRVKVRVRPRQRRCGSPVAQEPSVRDLLQGQPAQ